jgi:hypothetical protein|mmetsp:Transcript_78721/g.132032  ORF Transcript_78721/g.132032 Transcript_78721/m.132032 type:complete len:238 (+) Transcript_78721:671-1384(+)
MEQPSATLLSQLRGCRHRQKHQLQASASVPWHVHSHAHWVGIYKSCTNMHFCMRAPLHTTRHATQGTATGLHSHGHDTRGIVACHHTVPKPAHDTRHTHSDPGRVQAPALDMHKAQARLRTRGTTTAGEGAVQHTDARAEPGCMFSVGNGTAAHASPGCRGWRLGDWRVRKGSSIGKQLFVRKGGGGIPTGEGSHQQTYPQSQGLHTALSGQPVQTAGTRCRAAASPGPGHLRRIGP